MTAKKTAPAPENVITIVLPEPVPGRCNKPMPLAADRCGRCESHSGGHLSSKQVAKAKAASKARAKERRATDPEYKARINEASRRSHAKARAAVDPAKKRERLERLAAELGATVTFEIAGA